MHRDTGIFISKVLA